MDGLVSIPHRARGALGEDRIATNDQRWCHISNEALALVSHLEIACRMQIPALLKKAPDGTVLEPSSGPFKASICMRKDHV